MRTDGRRGLRATRRCARSRCGLEYEPPWRRSGLAAALAAARSDDVRRGVSTVGPHRDELVLTLDGLPARTHASQGEQRTLALALRLAAHRLVAERTGSTPVLVLDDVLSELDQRRARALLEHLPSGQVVITTANVLAGVRPARSRATHQGRSRDPVNDRDPIPISASLDEVVRSLRGPGRREVGGVFGRWEEAVGAQVAAHARPVRLDARCARRRGRRAGVGDADHAALEHDPGATGDRDRRRGRSGRGAGLSAARARPNRVIATLRIWAAESFDTRGSAVLNGRVGQSASSAGGVGSVSVEPAVSRLVGDPARDRWAGERRRPRSRPRASRYGGSGAASSSCGAARRPGAQRGRARRRAAWRA